jgi:hypothetical protein
VKQTVVSVELYADILRGGGETETMEVHCDPIALSTTLGIIMRLPIVTEHLVAHPFTSCLGSSRSCRRRSHGDDRKEIDRQKVLPFAFYRHTGRRR